MPSGRNLNLHRICPDNGAPSPFWHKSPHLLIIIISVSSLGATTPSSLPTVVHAASSANVTIINYSFRPHSINVTTGTSVVWTFATNGSDVNVQHTVTSNNKTGSNYVFNSGPLKSGQRFSFTFYSPGYYPYFCGFHPYMTGSINVTGSPITPPSPQTPAGDSSLLILAGIGSAVVVVLAGAVVYYRSGRKSRIPENPVTS